MATLYNTRISDTYQGLIKSIDNLAITASLKELTDGTGNNLGLYVNTSGDFKVTSILEFGSLKDTGENIIISKFVDAADGISNNDNDTTIPTTAAIVDYVAAQITIEDLDFTGDTGSGQIDLDSQIFAIGGTTNEITTVASGQSITFSLDSTGVYLPDNSTAITQTAGDNSTKIATTSYVDTLDAASDLDITDGTNTGDVNLNTQSLSILGTTNEIDTVVSGQGVTIGLPSTINTNLVGNVTGNLTGNVSGDLTGNVTSTSVLANGVTATTQSSSDDSTKVATTAYVKGLNNASDLDFTTDSGSGAVVLNSETLSVVGTTNEIETSGTGQEIQIGLPSSISTNLIGNVTGNLTGNVVGDVTGDLTGNSAGTHTGAVIGNVTGNVTGDLTGNADTATAWQTSRDLSVTGQASATIIGVDGTSNVSAAITLDNNSVTSKVLTGLPSPAASSVLATDTIVQGIGKLQSQINGLAGGLRFMGSWDATNNNPNLVSGGGEATSGTTTSTTANKLVDSTASFTTTVTVGDKVINQVDGQNALVSNVDSDTTLSLDTDIMVSGEAYTIDNSPFITQGHYYVVNVGGTTSLNGISNWSVGDWVIAGANNEWTKLDHTQIDGTGTGDANDGNIPRFTASNIIGDSIIRETGGNLITVSGTLSTTGNLNSQGDFAINTNKFTTQASTGNVAFTGDLAINTNKFTVNATSGNTVVAGTGTFAGNVTISKSNTAELQLIDTTNNVSLLFGADDNNTFLRNSSGLMLFQTNAGTTALTLSGANSTFAGDVYTTGTSNSFSVISRDNMFVDAGQFYIGADDAVTDDSFRQRTSSGSYFIESRKSGTWTNRLQINSAGTLIASQNATFAGDVEIRSGNKLILQRPNNGVATEISTDSTGAMILNSINDEGFFFNNAGTNAFKLDPINATFAGQVSVGNYAIPSDHQFQIANLGQSYARFALTNSQTGNGSSDGLIFQMESLNSIIKNQENGSLGFGTNGRETDILITSAGEVGIGCSPTAKFDILGQTLNLGGDNGSWNTRTNSIVKSGFITSPHYTNAEEDIMGMIMIGLSNANEINIGGGTGTYNAATDIKFFTASNSTTVTGTERLYIDSSGNVGIGTDPNQEGFGAGNRILSVKAPSSGGVGSIELIGLGNAEGDEVGYVNFMSQNATDSLASIVGLRRSDDTTGKLAFRTAGTTKFTIEDDNQIRFVGDFYFANNTSNGTDNASLNFSGGGGFGSTRGASIGLAGNENGNGGLMQLIAGNGANSQIRFYTSQTLERMRLQANGRLTLGDNVVLSAANNLTLTNASSAEMDINCTGGHNYRLESNSSDDFVITDKTAGGARMRITSGGDIQIPTDSAKIQLKSSGSSAYTSIFRDSTNQIVIENTAGTNIFQLDNSGRFTLLGLDGKTQTGSDVRFSTASGELYYNTSSKRYKTDIVNLENSLDKINALRPVRYKDKNTGVPNCGLIAEETVKVIPEVVFTKEFEGFDEPQIEGINYTDIVPFLIKSIQELKAEVDLLKKECKCKN